MLNLVRKDLLLLKRSLWLSALYVLLALFVFRTMPGGALSAATVGATYMFMIQALTQDDKNKSEIMLNSLPMRRQDIVLAKYLSVFIYAILVIIGCLLAQSVVSIIGIPMPIDWISLEKITGALVAMAVLISIYFPIYFKFGYLRSRMVGMILFLTCLFFLPRAVGLTVRELGGVGNPAFRTILAILQEAGNWLQTQADWQIATYLLVLALILMAASARLSLGFYRRREF